MAMETWEKTLLAVRRVIPSQIKTPARILLVLLQEWGIMTPLVTGDPFASPGFNSSQPSPFAQSQSPSIPSSGSMRTPTLEPVRQQESSPEYSHQQFIISKDIEVLSSKMDAIRASLDSLNQRLANIERLAYGEYDRQKRSQW